MDLTTQTPVQIDTRLAELDAQDAQLTRDIAVSMTDLRVSLGQSMERIRTRAGRLESVWLVSPYDTERDAVRVMDENPHGAENVHAAYATLHGFRQQVLVARAERTKLVLEFQRRGGWTRSFLVSKGHAHSSTSCSSCYSTTEYYWLTELSGSDEAQIVELAGERACTVCYSSAPVAVLASRSHLFTPDEIAAVAVREVRAVELEAKRAAKAAKAITNPDGSPLRGRWGVIATERTAEIEAVDEIHNHLAYDYAIDVAVVERIIQALAAKRGTSATEQHTLIQVKAEKKAAKTAREIAGAR